MDWFQYGTLLKMKILFSFEIVISDRYSRDTSLSRTSIWRKRWIPTIVEYIEDNIELSSTEIAEISSISNAVKSLVENSGHSRNVYIRLGKYQH